MRRLSLKSTDFGVDPFFLVKFLKRSIYFLNPRDVIQSHKAFILAGIRSIKRGEKALYNVLK